MDAPPGINDDAAVPSPATTMNDGDTGELYFRSKKEKAWLEPQQSTDRSPKKATKKNPAHCDARYYNQQSIQTNGVMVRYVCDGAVCMAKVVAHGKTAAACGVQLFSTLMNQTIRITGLVLPQKSRADSENKCNLSVQLQTYMNSLLIVL